MNTGKTKIILGGGAGGIVAASQLRKKLPSEHRGVLIEREARYIFSPSFLWLMTGLRAPEKISRAPHGPALHSGGAPADTCRVC